MNDPSRMDPSPEAPAEESVRQERPATADPRTRDRALGTGLSPWQRALSRFRCNRPAVLSAWILGLAILIFLLEPALKGPRFAAVVPAALTHSATGFSGEPFETPGVRHWFGTDAHGRDLLARVLHGARISLLVGMVGAGVSLVIGVACGTVAGYAGGRVDAGLMRLVDLLYTLPSIVFVIVLMTALQGLLERRLASVLPGATGATLRLSLLFAGLGAISWLTMARVVRGHVVLLRSQPFVTASRTLGASHARIMLRHILPNSAGVIIAYVTLMVPSIILYESFLSYLGLGVQPPQASLGSLMSEGAAQINPIRIYWWLLFFPGATLVSALLAFNFVGDGLRDALDPRSSLRA